MWQINNLWNMDNVLRSVLLHMACLAWFPIWWGYYLKDFLSSLSSLSIDNRSWYVILCSQIMKTYPRATCKKDHVFWKKKVPKIVICNMDLFFVAFIKIQGHSLHIGISMGTNEKKKLGKKAGFPVKNPAQIFFWCQTQCDLQWKVVVKYKHSSKERY